MGTFDGIQGEKDCGSGFGNTPGTDAAGANPDGLVGFPEHDANALKIRIPPPLCQVVGMTDPVPVHRTLITNFTTRHEGNLLD
jgi:hypothetical protein